MEEIDNIVDYLADKEMLTSKSLIFKKNFVNSKMLTGRKLTQRRRREKFGILQLFFAPAALKFLLIVKC